MEEEQQRTPTYTYSIVVLAIVFASAAAISVAIRRHGPTLFDDPVGLGFVLAPLGMYGLLAYRHAWRSDHLTVILLFLIPTALHLFYAYSQTYSKPVSSTAQVLTPVGVLIVYGFGIGILALVLEAHYWATQPTKKPSRRLGRG